MLQVANAMPRDQHALGSGAPSSTSRTNHALYQNILEVINESSSGTSSSYKVLYQTLLRSLIGFYQGPSQNALSVLDIAVTNADSWVEQLFLEVMDLDRDWIKTNVLATAEGDEVFRWRVGTKKLTIYIGDQSAEYLKVWGPDVNDDMDDGSADLTTTRKALWEWLIG